MSNANLNADLSTGKLSERLSREVCRELIHGREERDIGERA